MHRAAVPLLWGALVAATTPLAASGPSPANALRLTPIQSDVDYDTPSRDRWDACTVAAESIGGGRGWVVRDENGQLLRRFLDTRGDNKVDQWCYYKDGIEVYRDLDTNGNGKADQYRWLGTAGIRWGIDTSEDGQIDRWKWISAEEVTAELVAALRERDAARFRRLLLTPEELEELGLDDQQRREIGQKIATAGERFQQLASRQQPVPSDARWVHFGGIRPAALAASTDDARRDVLLYDNVSAVIEAEGDHQQVPIGTLVQVADSSWRMIDLPTVLMGDELAAAGGFFLQASLARRPADPTPAGGLSQRQQQLLSQLEQIDRDLQQAAAPERLAELNRRRADVVQQLAEAADPAERSAWIRQLADTISAAAQLGSYPDGVQRLKTLADELAAAGADEAAYVAFRHLSAEYGVSVQQPDADFAAVQEQWLENLEQFINTYPRSDDAAEAMLQLAIAEEFTGQESASLEWYQRIIDEFPSGELATKARGAKRRLELVGQTLTLRGPTLGGQSFELDELQGQVVVVHYWATWCEPCKQDMQTLKSLRDRYGDRGFVPVGVNLDSDRAAAERQVASAGVDWTHLYEPGGLDSRLANELGILTLPTTLLVDQQGRVVSRNLHAGALERELERLLR